MKSFRALSFTILTILGLVLETNSYSARAGYYEDPLDSLFYEDEYIGPGSRSRSRRNLGYYDGPDVVYVGTICEAEPATDWGGILGGIAAIGAAVAPAAATYLSNREYAKAIKSVNRDWANAETAKYQSFTQAYQAGVEACNLRYNSALQYTVQYGAAPISPQQMATFCNGQNFSSFAGFSGLYGNGVGGFGNPYTSAGYSPQFLSGMAGPYAGYYGNYGNNPYGVNPFGVAPYGSTNPYWGVNPSLGYFPNSSAYNPYGGYNQYNPYGYSQGTGIPGGGLVTPSGLPFFASGLPPRPDYAGAFGPQYAASAGYIPYGPNGYGSYYYASGGGNMYPTYGNSAGPYQCLGSSCLYGNAFQQNQLLYGSTGSANLYNFSGNAYGNAQFTPGNLGLQIR